VTGGGKARPAADSGQRLGDHRLGADVGERQAAALEGLAPQEDRFVAIWRFRVQYRGTPLPVRTAVVKKESHEHFP
jgi:hypothetical protein